MRTYVERDRGKRIWIFTILFLTLLLCNSSNCQDQSYEENSCQGLDYPVESGIYLVNDSRITGDACQSNLLTNDLDGQQLRITVLDAMNLTIDGSRFFAIQSIIKQCGGGHGQSALTQESAMQCTWTSQRRGVIQTIAQNTLWISISETRTDPIGLCWGNSTQCSINYAANIHKIRP